MNESVVVLHVHTYELLANCCISIKMGHIFSFTGTNKIILLCEDLNFCCCCCFVFIFAETLIKPIEPIEKVIDLLHMQAHQIGNTIKE